MSPTDYLKMIQRHVKTILLLTGLGTAPAALLFLFPSLLGLLLHVDIASDTGVLFMRHWGLAVGCIAALLMYAAFEAKFRNVVLIVASVGKGGLVCLLLAQWGNPQFSGLWPVLVFDSSCVLLYLGCLV